MDDTLVTVAIHTYEKAQILRSVLEVNGIEVFMQDVNPLLPAMSLGTRVRIRQSDLDKALHIIENMKNADAVSQMMSEQSNLLLPVDFSDYSVKMCEFSFGLARSLHLTPVLLHTYSVSKTVMATLGEAYATKKDDENKRMAESESSIKMNDFKKLIDRKMNEGVIPVVEYRTILREGIPEEQILDFSEHINPYAIVMGTRGNSHKDLDMIGSVTAEVMERAKVPVFTVPENTHFQNFENVKHVACSTNFDEADVDIYKNLMNLLEKTKTQDLTVHFIHFDSDEDVWSDVKLRGMKDLFSEKYPSLRFESHLLGGADILTAYDEFIRIYKVDVISMITHRRSLLTRMFNPSMARKIVFHTNTPMLVFHS